MQASLLNIGLGFLEGFALIISPCILPILPIILAGSLTGNRNRPFGIVLGFVIAFSLFTFFSRQLVLLTGIGLESIRHISYALLLFFGIILISERLGERFSAMTQGIMRTGYTLSTTNKSEEGFFSGLIFGGLVALIWTPCAGPILAAVIVQTVVQQTSFWSYLTLVAFSLGAAIPMLLIVIFGRKIMSAFTVFQTHAGLFRRIIGCLIVISVGYLMYVEFYNPAIASATVVNENQKPVKQLENGLSFPYQSPEIAGISSWINSPPLTISELKGKVVLIDFWTYSCINCIRTLPYLKSWYEKYHDKGLVIVGIHSPEFEFEKNESNVKRAVTQFGIKYPVGLDNQFITWRNFQNSYWPAHYLLDQSGQVVYTHFGEGEYEVTENNIQYLLKVSNKLVSSEMQAHKPGGVLTPETYLGYERASRFAGQGALLENAVTNYTFPSSIARHQWALQGEWRVDSEHITSAQNEASIKIHFNATNVFAVMGSDSQQPIKVKIKIIEENSVKESEVTVDRYQLYTIVDANVLTDAVVQLTAEKKGLQIYTFTFG